MGNDLGPVKQEGCVFPFIYNSTSHPTCIETHDDLSWCATAVDDEGKYIHGKWGFCSDHCIFPTPTPPPFYVSTETTVVFLTEELLTTVELVTTTEELTTVSSSETSVSSSSTSTTVGSTTSSSTTARRTTTTKTTSSNTVSPPFKPTSNFLQSLPAINSILAFAPDVHDPVREVLLESTGSRREA